MSNSSELLIIFYFFSSYPEAARARVPETSKNCFYLHLSVYKIEKLPQEDIPSLASTFADKSKGSIMDGENHL
ncbi:Protein CBG10634 [Caenorhabditis briggsae]|uniref:Uncharacterized protein n=2 Tax=Caenorhabditis briggsae TaxID=6238 RepID=A0AAE8ZW31_CAEBR|nr:Protein CBG10634 [Caenorhabditis briggsae]ULT85306.1 hypothetical protein L3Y34_013837 [Caenorhabditis briggsae]CAP29992.1 Protein CBG10634 [Caenorhabditis briggsae]